MRSRRRVRRGAIAALVTAVFGLGIPLAANAATWNVGDLFLGVSNGQYQVRDQAGVLKETLSTSLSPGGFTTGCAFDAADNFYGTYFSNNHVVKYDEPHPHASSLFGSGHSIPESVAFDVAGNAYVGNVGKGIDQFAANGTFIKNVISTRVDFFDIAVDQDTIAYGQEGADIKRVSISTGLSLPDFTTGTATQAFAMRYLPDTGILLADLNDVKRYNNLGVVVDTYDVLGEDSWFSLNLDPNGTSFWAGNFGTANYYKFNIATGLVEAGPFNTGTGTQTLFGLCLLGEPTVGGPGGRPPLDHFKCYAATAAADHPAAGQVVRLDDQFGESTATIAKVYNMCNPTAKNEERINQKDAHLVEYKLINRRSATGKFLKHRVTVDNQFGAMTLLVQRPNRLMVPSSKTLLGEQPGDPPRQLDHFLCYKIHSAGPFTNRTVSLEDQFGLERADIRKPRMLCNPVSKNGEAIQSGDEHLVCYIARGLGRPVGRSVITRNQFGVTDIRTNQVRHLCVPSTKRELEN